MLVCAPYPRFTLGSGERLPWIISKDTSLRKTLGAWQKVFGSKKIKAEVEGATQEVLTPRKARNSWRGQLNRRAARSVLSRSERRAEHGAPFRRLLRVLARARQATSALLVTRKPRPPWHMALPAFRHSRVHVVAPATIPQHHLSAFPAQMRHAEKGEGPHVAGGCRASGYAD